MCMKSHHSMCISEWHMTIFWMIRFRKVGSWILNGMQKWDFRSNSAITGGFLANGKLPQAQTPSTQWGWSIILSSKEPSQINLLGSLRNLLIFSISCLLIPLHIGNCIVNFQIGWSSHDSGFCTTCSILFYSCCVSVIAPWADWIPPCQIDLCFSKCKH